MFVKGDIYTGSGAVPVYDCWTQNVTKFDSSSFYNWEQDNEPVHDLKERTYLNWERLGFPTSSVPGMVLTVSADANISDPCQSNIYNDLSNAIAALPERIRYPILIEVGSFGDIGSIELKGIKFSETGSLEIINRNYAKSYSVSAIVGATETGDEFSKYNLISSVSSQDLSTTLTDTSCIHIATPVISATTDPRLVGNYKSVTNVPGYATNSERPIVTGKHC